VHTNKKGMEAEHSLYMEKITYYGVSLALLHLLSIYKRETQGIE